MYRDVTPVDFQRPSCLVEVAGLTMVSKLDDPDAYGSERVALYNVSLDEVPVVNWERKTVQKDEVPFTFTGHKFLAEARG